MTYSINGHPVTASTRWRSFRIYDPAGGIITLAPALPGQRVGTEDGEIYFDGTTMRVPDGYRVEEFETPMIQPGDKQ